MSINSNSHTSYGFTLIEAMIAVTILSFSIAGPLFTASRTMVATEISRDQLTASYLAQEAIEYARAMRDDAYLARYPTQQGDSAIAWSNFKTVPSAPDGLLATCSFPNICALGRARGGDGTPLITPCPSGICPPSASFNLTDPGTLFTSTFQATATSLDEEKIVSAVSWDFHGTKYTVTIVDHLTSWQ